MNKTIDLESIKDRADLLAVSSQLTSLKKVASTGGGEWAGPCPFCGGKDRFRVEPFAKRWLCRQCTDGKWQDVITFIGLRDGLDPKKGSDLAEICRRAGGASLIENKLRRSPPTMPAYAPPPVPWQESAARVTEECERTLWDPKYQKVLDYLHSRGLKDKTIRQFKLGYCATGHKEGFGREIAGLWVPRGVVIPCIVAGDIWYLKIRLAPGVPCQCQHCKATLPGPGKCSHCSKDTRYLGVKGNRPAVIYNADELQGSDIALFCEGEFDCMIAHQELNDTLTCLTLGCAYNRLDLATWGMHLVYLRVILSAYDADRAGENGAKALVDLAGHRVKEVHIPEGYKDINQYYQAGGDLWKWIEPYLNTFDPYDKLPEAAIWSNPIIESGVTIKGARP